MHAVRTNKRSIIMAVSSFTAMMLVSTQLATQSISENIKPVGQVCLADQPCVGSPIDTDGSIPIGSTSTSSITIEPVSAVEEPTTVLTETALVAVEPESVAFDAAATYQMNCFACHGTGAAGAPLLGEAEVWEEKLAKGIGEVMANVINGINAMPARGLCASCSDDDLKALVDYIISQ